jgi:nucleoside-triphosphatase
MIPAMKRKLLLTGAPGVGKTTLICRALDSAPSQAASGFITRELRQEGRRVGFAVETLAGAPSVLAHVGIPKQFRVGRYGVDLAAFESSALPAIDPARTSAPLIVIDEIGKMECLSSTFRQLVLSALASDQAVLASIALHGDRFIEGVKTHPDISLLHVTQDNRDDVLGQVVKWAQEVLSVA